MGARFAIVLSGFSLVYLFLLFHLFELQVLNNEEFTAKAESQYLSAEYLQAHRGGIYFTDKSEKTLAVAVSRDFPMIYAVPKEIEDSQEAANILAPILNDSVASLEDKLSKEGDLFELLVKKADADLVKKISSLKIEGIYVRNQSDRFYPFENLAAQLLGFVGFNDDGNSQSGRYGLEKYYDEELSGENGAEKEGKIVSPQNGEDIILTIDPNIQNEARRIIKKLVSDFGAKSGSVMVQEPNSGKILVMESIPDFNPNSYSDSDLRNFINPSVQSIYEPGSVFKVITMAIGLDSGKFTPSTTYLDKGNITVSGRKIQNWDLKAHGKVTMTNVIELSLNTGAAYAQSLIGRDIFKNYLEKFGFGEKTDIDLPGEVAGDLNRLSSKSPEVAFATASFGQGVAVTPLGLINAFSAIANGGNLMRPYVNQELGPDIVGRVISSSAAKMVTEMMVSALDKAEVGKIKGYSLAGKTGTAQVPDFDKGGYTDKVVNTYVGFGPTSNARFVILIKLDEPDGAPLAGATVVPAFRDLAQFIINYYNIPPDRPNE